MYIILQINSLTPQHALRTRDITLASIYFIRLGIEHPQRIDHYEDSHFTTSIFVDRRLIPVAGWLARMRTSQHIQSLSRHADHSTHGCFDSLCAHNN